MHWHYRAHGLAVASEVELPLPPDPCPEPGDLTLQRGPDREVPHEDPGGCALARFERPDGSVFYSLGREGPRTVLRYPGLCEFVGDARFADLTVHLQPGADPGLLPVLAAGAVLAVHLKLRGELVLHASAVRLDGRSIAIVGASGMGKSTLAALLCTNGADLVTDDVLRVDIGNGAAPRGYPGSIESRLREGARPLADDAAWTAASATADGRLAVRARSGVDAPVPLAACVVPLRSRGISEVSVRRLQPLAALLRLVRFPRVMGWTEPASSAREFQLLGDLVERVPVFEASIPWGPPFGPEVVPALVSGIVEGSGQR